MADEMTKEEVIGTLALGAKEIESVLEDKFGAQGTGLHSKALSIEGYLGAALLRKIQYVATIRNKAMHEGAFENVPFESWTRAKEEILAALGTLDAPAPGSVSAAIRPLVTAGGAHIGHFLGVGIVLVVLAVFGVAMFYGRDSSVHRHASSVREGLGNPTTPPIWSIEHPAHETQAFPWREEQAAFIARGEKGPLPAETIWKVTSEARQVQRKGKAVLEMDIQLGGGKSSGKVFFATRSSFGYLETNEHAFEVEIGGRPRGASPLTGAALRTNGRWFGVFDKPFECRREVPNGCGEWSDKGVGFLALSAVSYGNALKIADVR